MATAACAASAGPTHSSCSSNCCGCSPSHCITPSSESSCPTIGTLSRDRVSKPISWMGYCLNSSSSRHSLTLLMARSVAHLPAQPCSRVSLGGGSIGGATMVSCSAERSNSQSTPASATMATLPTSIISRSSSGMASGAASRCMISRIWTSDSRVISFGFSRCFGMDIVFK